MNKLTALLALVALSVVTPLGANDYLGSVEQSILRTTIKIELSFQGEIVACGTGNLIKKRYDTEKDIYSYLLVTCDHVVSKFSRVPYDDIVFSRYIRNERGTIVSHRSFRKKDNEVSSFMMVGDSGVDVAFIKLSMTYDFFDSILVNPIISDEDLKKECTLNTEVMYSGCPIFLNPVLFRAKIIQLHIHRYDRHDFDVNSPAHIIDTTVIGGQSGGGVYTLDGKFIGVISFNLGGKMGGFVGVDHFRDLLDTMMDLVN